MSTTSLATVSPIIPQWMDIAVVAVAAGAARMATGGDPTRALWSAGISAASWTATNCLAHDLRKQSFMKGEAGSLLPPVATIAASAAATQLLNVGSWMDGAVDSAAGVAAAWLLPHVY